MTALLWARPVFAAILFALVGLHVWTACAVDDSASQAKRQPRTQPTRQPTRQQ